MPKPPEQPVFAENPIVRFFVTVSTGTKEAGLFGALTHPTVCILVVSDKGWQLGYSNGRISWD